MRYKQVKGFYPVNNAVLQIDLDDIDRLKLNHLFMRKENLSRVQYDLPKGQFCTSLYEVSTLLKITKSKASRLVKEFVELGIIKLIKKGTSKNELSVYEYISVNEYANAPTAEYTVAQTTTTPKQEVIEDLNYNYNEGDLIEKVEQATALGLTVDVCNYPLMDSLKVMDLKRYSQLIQIAKGKGAVNVSYIIPMYFSTGGVANEVKPDLVEMDEVDVINDEVVTNDPVDVVDDITDLNKVESVEDAESELVLGVTKEVAEKIGKRYYQMIINGTPSVVKGMNDYALYYAKEHGLDVDLVEKIIAEQLA